mgnify:CR=1 FL=1
MRMDVQGLGKRIGGVDVLRDITVSVSSGRVLGLAGVNGSGKTMLMRAMVGLIKPTSGAVSIDGAVLGRDLSFPPSAGILIESPAFLDTRSGLDNLRLVAAVQRKIGMDEVRAVIVDVGLDPDDGRRFRKYSLGMKQRLGIAAAVMERPDLIILDEPTNALDSDGVRMIHRVVERERGRGAAIVLACHDAAVLRALSDEIVYLAEGHMDGREVREGSSWVAA